MSHRHRLLIVAVIAVMAMSCSDDTDTTTGTTTSEPVATTTSVASSTTMPAPTTTSPPSSTSVVSTTTSTTMAPSTTSPAVTLGEVIASIESEQFPDPPLGRIVCDEPDDMIVSRGTVLYCDTEVLPGYEGGIWLIVITDDNGTAAYMAGTDVHDLHDWFGPGLLCRDLLATPYLEGAPRDRFTYLFLLAYWFQDGQPDQMDADRNGIPCETLFDAAVVDAVWVGGMFPGAGGRSPTVP